MDVSRYKSGKEQITLGFWEILWRGFAMGVAELVPGISGGTVAFITNIYRELISSLASFNFSSFKNLLRPRLFWERHNVRFLLPLGLGMFAAVLFLANLIQYSLIYFRPAVWSLFLAVMIVALSKIVKEVQITRHIPVLLGGIFLGTGSLWLVPAENSAVTDMMIFFGGALAICAWILPGISGSYILLVLGLYPTIIGAIASFQLSVLAVFSLGCIFGIVFFVRVVDWLYSKHADRFISFVVGFMLMSLVRLWPWQAEHMDGVGSGLGFLGPNQYEALTGQSPYLSVVLVFAFLGIGSLWLINRRK
jgi:putative membrane protein